MTPPAAATARPRGTAARSVKAPARPRRVSGPARPLAVRAGAVALPAPRPARRSPGRSAPRRSSPGVALRAIHAIDGASRSALVERLIRGRLWIGVIAFALIGIVAMQLLVLKLNNQIGASLARAVALQRQNVALGIERSESSAGNLVEPQAAAAGMTFATPGSLRFLTAHRADVHRAAQALARPVQPSETAVGSSETAVGSSETAPEG